MEKQQIIINTGKNKTIRLVVDKKLKNQRVINMVKKGAQIAFDYFDEVKNINFEVELIYSRDEFDKKMGRKTESWLIGNSFGKRFVIFSPEKIEEHTSHKKQEFIPLITHETVHVLHEKISSNYSYWLSEGIAQNVAGQEKKKGIECKNIKHFLHYSLFKNSNYRNFIAHQGYEISNRLVKFLMSEYSKKQVMSLLKIKYDSVVTVEEKFCKILATNKKTLASQFEEVLGRRV